MSSISMYLYLPYELILFFFLEDLGNFQHPLLLLGVLRFPRDMQCCILLWSVRLLGQAEWAHVFWKPVSCSQKILLNGSCCCFFFF